MYKWKVCPIQGRQLRDVREEDLFGDFRLCDSYRGGGGYDQFPRIYSDRHDVPIEGLNSQFVVQLYGCPLNCYYCYVTRDGVFGHSVEYSTEELIEWYRKSKQAVFHLMGGAPAIYLKHWQDIVKQLDVSEIFHSDLLLIEGIYKKKWLRPLAKDNVLLAIDIKGVTPVDFYHNTGRKFTYRYKDLFWKNFDKVVDSDVNFYLTFTNPALPYLKGFKERLVKRYGDWVLEDSFVIDLIDYDALK